MTGNDWTGSVLTSTRTMAGNTWYHIVATYDGSVKYLYINGIREPDSVNTSGSLGPNTYHRDFTLGSYDHTANGDYVNFFGGKMDDVRIYNRALSNAEIAAIYEAGLDGHEYTYEPMFTDINNGDYHLKSERGRYWPAQNVWVLDDVTSPCVDGGNPNDNPMNEPMPNGGRIDMVLMEGHLLRV